MPFRKEEQDMVNQLAILLAYTYEQNLDPEEERYILLQSETKKLKDMLQDVRITKDEFSDMVRKAWKLATKKIRRDFEDTKKGSHVEPPDECHIVFNPSDLKIISLREETDE